MEILKDVEDQEINFDQFLIVLKKAEEKLAEKGNKPNIDNYENTNPRPNALNQSEELVVELDAKVMDFLRLCIVNKDRLLDEYRKKSVQEGNYSEAKKAKEKSDELKKQYLLYYQSTSLFKRFLIIQRIE